MPQGGEPGVELGSGVDHPGGPGRERRPRLGQPGAPGPPVEHRDADLAFQGAQPGRGGLLADAVPATGGPDAAGRDDVQQQLEGPQLGDVGTEGHGDDRTRAQADLVHPQGRDRYRAVTRAPTLEP